MIVVVSCLYIYIFLFGSSSRNQKMPSAGRRAELTEQFLLLLWGQGDLHMAIWKFAVETVRKVSLPFQRRRNFTDKYIFTGRKWTTIYRSWPWHEFCCVKRKRVKWDLIIKEVENDKNIKRWRDFAMLFFIYILSLGVLVNQVTGSHAQPCNITQCCNITGNRLSIQHVPVVLTQVPPVCFMANASCCWPRKKVVVVGAPRQRKREPLGSQGLARMGVLTNRRKGKRKKNKKQILVYITDCAESSERDQPLDMELCCWKNGKWTRRDAFSVCRTVIKQAKSQLPLYYHSRELSLLLCCTRRKRRKRNRV